MKDIIFPKNAVVFDDHRMFAESFSMTLERLGFFDTVTIVANEREVFQFFRTRRIGTVYFFLDYFIPDINTIHLMSDVRKLNPAVQIIIVTSLTNPLVIQKLMAQKPQAFISKTLGIADLADCMNALQEDKFYVSSNIEAFMKDTEQQTIDFNDLTSRELEILTYIFQGKSILETAEKMNLSRHTVATHRRNMMAKTKTKSVNELLAHATANGLIPIGS